MRGNPEKKYVTAGWFSSVLILSWALTASASASAPASAFAAAPAPGSTQHVNLAARQDHGVLRNTIEHFLKMQAGGLPGQVSVSVGAIDPRLSLPACASPEAFLPGGSKAWGKTSVGVRCTAPAAWTIYVAAQVHIDGDYYITATPLAPGQVVQMSDLAKTRGDLGALQAGVVTDPAQAIGLMATRSIAPGAPLARDALRGQQVVMQGQAVRLVSSGPGFKVSAEGRALGNGTEGQIVQARASNGQTVSGIAKAGGVVEVTW